MRAVLGAPQHAFAETPGCGGAALRFLSPTAGRTPRVFMSSPVPIVQLSASPCSSLFPLSCLLSASGESG